MTELMPEDEDLFSIECIMILLHLNPGLNIEYSKPLVIILEGKLFDLSPVYRLSNLSSFSKELVENYFAHLLEAEDALQDEALYDFDYVREKIFPRIQSRKIIRELNTNGIAYTDWVNDCIITYVIDFPSMTISVNRDQVNGWKTNMDELHDIALDNLRDTMESIDFEYFELKNGLEAIILKTEDGYDASRIITPELFQEVSARFGGDFYVGIPARDMLFAIPANHMNKKLLNRVKRGMMKEYNHLPYPITSKLFYVTLDGVAAGFIDKPLASDNDNE